MGQLQQCRGRVERLDLRRDGARRALLAVADRLTAADDPLASLVRGLLIPEGRYRGEAMF